MPDRETDTRALDGYDNLCSPCAVFSEFEICSGLNGRV